MSLRGIFATAAAGLTRGLNSRLSSLHIVVEEGICSLFGTALHFHDDREDNRDGLEASSNLGYQGRSRPDQDSKRD